MAYVGQEENIMRPKMGDMFMSIPITFDYSGGRRESRKLRNIWVVVLSIITVIFSIGMLFTLKQVAFPFRIVIAFIFFNIMLVLIRYLLLGENKVRKYYETLESVDYQANFQPIWGIYEVDEDYPYFVRYRNGKSGIFIRLNKDVILGKYEESEYQHYEAIGDAYNIAASSNISMCHVDYMDQVGNDERLDKSFEEIEEVENTDLHDLLLGLFTHLQREMNERVTTFDVYVFTYRGSDIAAWNTIQRVLSCFLDANYVNYHVMDSEDLKELFRSLNGVHEFSVSEASLMAMPTDPDYSGVKAIKVIHSDGSEDIINKTREELREEAERKEREAELAKSMKGKKAKKQPKKKKKGQADESVEEFNLFD